MNNKTRNILLVLIVLIMATISIVSITDVLNDRTVIGFTREGNNLTVLYSDGTSESLGALPEGLQGEKGIQGETGMTGAKGEKGDTGDIGPQGIRGERGEQGIQGDQGIQGEKGEIGAKGDKGDKGDIGLTGPQGIQGIQGIQGEQGEPGKNGTDGRGIQKIYLYSTNGNIDTYRILYTDGTYFDFNITNGRDGILYPDGSEEILSSEWVEVYGEDYIAMRYKSYDVIEYKYVYSISMDTTCYYTTTNTQTHCSTWDGRLYIEYTVEVNRKYGTLQDYPSLKNFFKQDGSYLRADQIGVNCKYGEDIKIYSTYSSSHNSVAFSRHIPEQNYENNIYNNTNEISDINIVKDEVYNILNNSYIKLIENYIKDSLYGKNIPEFRCYFEYE